MNPFLTSLAGLIITLTGAWAMLLMLELRGKPGKKRAADQWLVRTHRITGYIFLGLFCVILMVMLFKAGNYQEEFSPRSILHIALGILIIPLFAIKILITRRFKRTGTRLQGLGLTVFLALFVLNAITGGYYFMQHADMHHVFLFPQETSMSAALGQQLVTVKCVKCHTLERVFKAFKSEQGWTDTVNRMAFIDTPHILDDEVRQIIHYLITQQKRREKLDSVAQRIKKTVGKLLVEQKCSPSCHEVERIYAANKSRSEWVQTVEKMIGYADKVNFLNQKEKKAVVEYLVTRNRIQAESNK
ncbi:MAG: photosystem P840 reaction-center cytochrome c-551 [Candidatus Electrothrix sp. YB6]